MTSAGRPSKLTPETIKTLTDAIGLGASYVDACKAAGIDYSTFAKWRQKADEQTKGEFFEFFNALAVEEAAATLRHLAVINNAAAKGDWKASLEWLKRRRRGEWGDNVDVTSGGAPLQPPQIIEVVRNYEKPPE
jgi:transposase-like protein